MNHHRDHAPDYDFDDPGGWNRASYSAHPIDSMEPLSDEPNPYRQAALYHMRLMWVIDDFITAAPDARLAVVAVAVVLGWPSARGLTLGDISDQLGCSLSTLTRCIARFKTLAGLDSIGAIQCIRSGAGSNGEKPTSIQA